MKIGIVIPTIRQESINLFFEKWHSVFTRFASHDLNIYVVEDNPTKSFEINTPIPYNHYSWKEIEEDLKDKSWIISKRNSGIRCYGFYKAWQDKCCYTITLDDDVTPFWFNCFEKHIEKLNDTLKVKRWTPSCSIRTRGLPYDNMVSEYPVFLNHGLWKNIPDLDGITQISSDLKNAEPVKTTNKYFPMCWMNLSFRTSLTPIMFSPLMGLDQPFDRWEDIWCGVFAQKIMQHLHIGYTSGEPYVNHDRVSNKWRNLEKECKGSGYEINEILWKKVDDIILSGNNIKDCYLEIANKLAMVGEYWDRLRDSMHIWVGLYK